MINQQMPLNRMFVNTPLYRLFWIIFGQLFLMPDQKFDSPYEHSDQRNFESKDHEFKRVRSDEPKLENEDYAET